MSTAAQSERVEILGIKLAVQQFDDAVESLIGHAQRRGSFRAHFCNVHAVVEAQSNIRLRTAFESADLLCMDGMPLVWLARRRGFAAAERVCGPDMMLALSDRGRSSGLRHYYLGGAADTPAALAAALTTRYPGLLVAGFSSPPFGQLTTEQNDAIVDQVNAAKPDILWIGLGLPKQEIWAADQQARLDVPLVLPVGAAFDFHAGRTPRAPRWMQRLGLEWLQRLSREPRRLGWRYLRTNVLFVFLVAKGLVRSRGRESGD